MAVLTYRDLETVDATEIVVKDGQTVKLPNTKFRSLRLRKVR